ncbi:MFS transporter [Paractinoplanes rhizophilus]|jgi:EmrB/QacA subfamily drug resistance transporter|uniref:MFS transporter n=1 Tax=Paractinoplanes rhizophilus TaxID=1416877 RepID=A0ABW2I576_9ACTN|nr:MFS transporter [Actinoplanes sp.]
MTTTTTPAAAVRPPAAGRRRWLVLGLLAAAQLMLVLDVTVVNVALPDISAALHLDRAVIPWVMTAYTLVFGGLMLLGGRIADIVGPRRVMLTGLAVFTVSSLVCATAGSAPALLAGRAAQGLGAALFSPAALALVTATFTGPARAKALGVWGTLGAAGTAFGVTLGGLVTSALGWEWIFAINLPIGVLLLVLLPFLVAAPARRATSAALDVPGALLVTAGTAAVIYGLVNAGGSGWSAPGTLLPLGAGLVLWILFALVERATAAPLLRVALLTERPVAAGAFLMLVATALMVGEFFLGSFVLQRAYGLSAVEVGLIFLPVGIAVGAGAHTAGRLLAKISTKVIAATGLALAGAGQATAAFATVPAVLVTGLAVAALGTGAVFVTAFTAALATADPATGGLRSALVNTFHELGGAFGVAVLSTVAGAALAAVHPAAGDFTAAFTVAAVLAGGAAVTALALVPAVVRAPAPGHHHAHGANHG